MKGVIFSVEYYALTYVRASALARDLFAFRISAVAAEVTAGGVFELASAFGALADQVRHLRLSGLGLGDGGFRGPERFGLIVEASIYKQKTFGHGLFGRGKQPFVEPDGVRTGHLVQTA